MKIVPILIALVLFTLPVLAEEPLLLTGPYNNIPVSYLNDKNEAVGVDIAVLKEAARRSGIAMEFVLVPWKRALFLIETGRVDGGFTLFVTPERKRFARYTSTPLHRTVMKAYVHPASDFTYTSLADLYGKKVAVHLGFSISDAFDEAAKKKLFQVQYVDTPKQLVQLVLEQRVDVMVSKQSNIQFYLSRSRQQLKEAGIVNKGQGAFLVISRKASLPRKSEVFATLNATLAEMERDGSIERVANEFLASQ